MTEDHALAAPIIPAADAPADPPHEVGISGATADDYTIGDTFTGHEHVEGSGIRTYQGVIEAAETLDSNPLVESGFERNPDTPAVMLTLRDCQFIDLPDPEENA